ncbi:MAG: hypothetical protein EOM06_09320 [Sphingobacteriia bacterium]|nr:hypothetical protein [Sphingobacteriia bacterium]
MKWTEKQIRYIIQDMIEENPLACRALLEISEIVFTEKVPTMAVSLSAKPVLNINPIFCNQHLKTENDVKTVLLHEFLHVLLRHTEKYKISTPLLNIALDAIINSIIYRYKGLEYADFFRRFYKGRGIQALLKPIPVEEFDIYLPTEGFWLDLNRKIYSGKYCADDLFELLTYLRKKINKRELLEIILLGNHDDHVKTPVNIRDILDNTLKKMDGVLIWNKPASRGIDIERKQENQDIMKFRMHKWQKSTFRLLNRCLVNDKRVKTELTTCETLLPVLSSHDSRALARFNFSRIIPLSKTEYLTNDNSQRVSIYLDVSGSMNSEIEAVVSLLSFFKTYIRMPLWVFSNDVEKARFVKGKLEYKTTFGTSISCVFDHLRKNKTKKCLIVTDGYVETITDSMLENLRKDAINVLVSADGNPAVFKQVGIPYLQLEKQ